MNFNDLMQRYVNCSYEELLAMAKKSIAELSGEMLKCFQTKETAIHAYVLIAVASIGADNILSPLECKFLDDLFGIGSDLEETRKLILSWGRTDAMELVDKLADSLSSDGKANLINVCLTFLSVDEKLSKAELSFIQKLMM